MKLSEQEIKNVSKLEPFKRYQYFIKKIVDFEELWTIKDENNGLALSKIEENTLISLWAAKEYIKSNLDDGWKKCVPVKISLDDFEESIVPLITANDYLVNVFPVNGKSGFIVNISEFIRDLNEELKHYQ